MATSKISLWHKKFEDSEKETRKKFGQEVKKLRRLANYSREEFAEFMNISEEALIRVETGYVDPTTNRLQEKVDYALNKSFMVISL